VNADTPALGAADERVARRVRRALGPVEVAGARVLTGGLYSVQLLELAGGRSVVLKPAPHAAAAVTGSV
jgi:hypothetical protein